MAKFDGCTGKRVMENIQKLDKRMTENIPGLCGKLSDNIEKNDKLMDEIKSLVVSEFKEVKNEIGEIKTEIKETVSKVQNMED